MAAKKIQIDSGVEEEPVSYTLDTFLAEKNQAYGDKTIIVGSSLKRDPPRLPTSVFAVDFVTAGGLPLWGTTCFWGPEGGGKTTLCISVLRAVQHLCWNCFNWLPYCTCSGSSLLMRSVWADAEGTLDRNWAEANGADPDRYLVALADYGEQYINIMDAALQADDCGLVVLDSLANLVPSAEFDAPAEDQFYAVQARLISRCVRKVKQRLIRERKREHPVTVLFTNQMRAKMGDKYNPETMPGGFAMKHEFSLLLRCVKKALKREGADKKFIDEKRKMDVGNRFSFAIRKAKVLTLAGVGEYLRIKEDMPDFDLQRGMIDDFNTVWAYAKEFKVVEKVSKGYAVSLHGFDDEVFPKVENLKSYWKENFQPYVQVQKAIIHRAKRRLLGAEL